MQIGNDQTFYKRIKQLKVLRACFDLPFQNTLFSMIVYQDYVVLI